MNDQFKDLVPQEIYDLYLDLSGRDYYQTRDALWDKVYDVYTRNKFTGAISRVVNEKEASNRGDLLVNLISARVRQKQAYYSLPDRYILPIGEPPAGYVIAEAVNRLLDKLHNDSKMPLLYKDMGAYHCLYGSAVMGVFPTFEYDDELEEEEWQVRYFLRSPRNCYAEVKTLYPTTEYLYIIFYEKKTGYQLLETYPEAPVGASSEEYELLEFWTPTERRVIIKGGKSEIQELEKRRIEHNYGFIPIRIIQNVRCPETIDGKSDVAESIALHENINELLLLGTEEIREGISPDKVVVGNAQVVEDPFTKGKEYHFPDGEGKVDYLHRLAPNARDAQYQAMQNERLFRVATQWPAPMSGEMEGSIITGSAVTRILGGVSDDLQSTREQIAYEQAILDNYAIKLLKKFRKKPIYVSGIKGKVPYRFTIEPSDLPNRAEIFYSFKPLSHDAGRAIVAAIQLVQSKLFDKRTALELLSFVDTDEVLRRLEEEEKRELQKQLALAGLLQAQAQPQAPPAIEEEGTGKQPEQVEKEAYGLQRGKTLRQPPRAITGQTYEVE